VAGAATVVLGAAVIACQQGKDTRTGGQGGHILIGCSRIAGALHSDDRLDGRTSIGTMAGPNALGFCRPYAIDLRLRVPGGTRFYGVRPSVSKCLLLVGVRSTFSAASPPDGRERLGFQEQPARAEAPGLLLRHV
jgi:hypothetical protein